MVDRQRQLLEDIEERELASLPRPLWIDPNYIVISLAYNEIGAPESKRIFI